MPEFVIRGGDVLGRLCLHSRKWGLLLSGNGEPLEEIRKAAPYLPVHAAMDLYCGETVYVLCDSEAEASSLYRQTVGEDGPTQDNPYDGPARVYALLCRDDGKLWTANT